MKNPNHLAILKQGVKAWNKWRTENDVSPQLSFTDLSGLNLEYANLNDAYIGIADLSGVNLKHAYLSNADLRGADLSNADLRNANLSGANFIGTNLYGTKLIGADLSGAFMGYTNIGRVDLSGVDNLESVDHYGPSSIGIDTIYNSHGNIPDKFLRGCGVPEDFITYMRSLTVKPIEFYSCFISYSSKDEEFLLRLYADLQNAGVRCWYAAEDLKIGDKFRDRIDESIRLHDKLLLVLSENSVSSQWVEKEVETAMEKEREQGKTVLFPVQLDYAVSEIKTGWAADVRRTRHIGDFSDWKNHDSYKKAFERLMRDLKAGDKR